MVDDEVEFLFRETETLRRPFVDLVGDGLGELRDDVRDCGHGVVLRQVGAMGSILPQCQGNRLQHLCNKFRLDKRVVMCVVRYCGLAMPNGANRDASPRLTAARARERMRFGRANPRTVVAPIADGRRERGTMLYGFTAISRTARGSGRRRRKRMPVRCWKAQTLVFCDTVPVRDRSSSHRNGSAQIVRSIPGIV